MVRKITEHENIYIHVKKNTFYGILSMIGGFALWLLFFLMEHRQFDKISGILISEIIFLLLGTLLFLGVGALLILFGWALIFDNEQKDL